LEDIVAEKHVGIDANLTEEESLTDTTAI